MFHFVHFKFPISTPLSLSLHPIPLPTTTLNNPPHRTKRRKDRVDSWSYLLTRCGTATFDPFIEPQHLKNDFQKTFSDGDCLVPICLSDVVLELAKEGKLEDREVHRYDNFISFFYFYFFFFFVTLSFRSLLFVESFPFPFSFVQKFSKCMNNPSFHFITFLLFSSL